MKPRPFNYVRPDSVAEAIDALAHYGERARILAGGQSLIAMLNLRLVDAEAIIDISRLKELSEISRKGNGVEVGAAVTQNRLLAWPELRSRVPLLAKIIPWVGHFQTRNRGTICGSLSHADPSSEIPLALAMLGGSVVLRSKRGTRVLTADQFQTGVLSTAREPDELVVAAHFPANGSKGVAFREAARRHGDFAIVGVGAVRKADGEVILGIGGVSSRPFVTSLVFESPDEIAAGIEKLLWRFDGYEDMHATPRMRRDLVRRMAPLVIEEAMA
nr:MAG: carbon monoxide dehydrogenase [Hyphomicrobiales bacterium]